MANFTAVFASLVKGVNSTLTDNEIKENFHVLSRYGYAPSNPKDADFKKFLLNFLAMHDSVPTTQGLKNTLEARFKSYMDTIDGVPSVKGVDFENTLKSAILTDAGTQLTIKMNASLNKIEPGNTDVFREVIRETTALLTEASMSLDSSKALSLREYGQILTDRYTEIKEGGHAGIYSGYKKIDQYTGGAKPGDLIFIVAPPKQGKCVVGETELLVKGEGIVTLKDLSGRYGKSEGFSDVKDLSVYVEGKWVNVTHFYNGGMKPTLSLSFQGTDYCLQGTSNHPVKVLKDDGLVWKNLRDIKKDDKVYLSPYDTPGESMEGVSIRDSYYIVAFAIHGRYAPMNTAVFLSSDESLNRILLWFEDHEWKYSCYGKGTKHAIEVHSTQASDWLKDKGVFPTPGEALPSCWKRMSASQLKYMLAGMVGKSGFAFGTEVLAKGVCKVLQYFGVVSKVSKQKKSYMVGISAKMSVSLSKLKFAIEGRRFSYNKSFKPIKGFKGLPYLKVFKSTPGEALVYDLTVPDGHAFWSDGFISHNSTFCLNWAYNAAIYGGYNVAIASLEMSDEKVARTMYTMHASNPELAPPVIIPYKDYKEAKLDVPQALYLHEVVIPDYVNNDTYGNVFFIPTVGDNASVKSGGRITVSDIASQLSQFELLNPIDLLIIDYPTLLDPTEKGFKGDLERGNAVVRELKRLAMSWGNNRGIAIIGPHHINRQGQSYAEKTKGEYNFAAISSVNGIEKDADYVFTLWADDELRQKQRVRFACLASRDDEPVPVHDLHMDFPVRRVLDIEYSQADDSPRVLVREDAGDYVLGQS